MKFYDFGLIGISPRIYSTILNSKQDTFRIHSTLKRRIIMRMNIILLLMIGAFLQVSAISYAQKITLTRANASIVDIFKEIQARSGYDFVYSNRLISKAEKINISVKDAPLLDVLEECFENQSFTYLIKDKTIVIKEKERDFQVRKQVIAIDITGKVVDEAGAPLPGVNVTLKSNNKATTTDMDGNYSISIPNDAETLIFSSIGYDPQEIQVNNKTTIDIVLVRNVQTMDEVVVVAYGTQKKATLTGAIATINTKEIKQSPAANLAVTLTGRLPGLYVQQVSGEPGRDQTMLYMRGKGTVNGSSPIILVDGVERSLTSIDPNEVESVSILKDASSTALFGVRGANGVILVTTKRGTDISPTIGLSVETGIQAFTRTPSRLDSYDWALLKNQAWHNDVPEPEVNDFPPYSDYALERYRLQDEPEVFPNKNWMDMLMKEWVPQTRYNLTINGKGARAGYFVNIGYLDQSGQWNIDPSVKDYDPSQYMKRYNFRSNIDATLNKNKTLKTFLNVAGYLEHVNGPYVGASGIRGLILNRWPSIQPGPLTPEGEVLVGGSGYHESPWAQINRTGYKKESRSSITASWGMDQDFSFITKGLSSKVMLSYDTYSVHNMNASKQYQYWVQVIDPNTQTADGRDSVYYQRTRADFDNTPLATSISASFQSFFNMQFQTNYSRTFSDKHSVTGLFLAQQQALIKPSDPLPFNVRGLATRLTYSFNDKYLAEFNAGYNGSEQFAKGSRYGFFPSFSAGWNVHNEPFFNNLTSVVSLLKIRGSYGTVGGDQLGGRRFLYLDEIKRGYDGYSTTLGRGGRIQESFFGNPNVQWEVAKKANLGIELGLFSQLNITADFFKERRDNVFIFRGVVPMMIGVPSAALAPANVGIIENKGYEVELSYNKAFSSDFSIVSKLNINYAANKILFYDEIQFDEEYPYRYRVTGYKIGQQWGYNTLGFFNSQEEIDKYGVTYQGKAPRPGDLKYEDLNRDKQIDNKDVTPIGEASLPEYNWGAAAFITYKNFDLSFLFQGAFKVTGALGIWEQYDFRERHLHAWTEERVASGQDILYPALSLSSSSSQTSNSFFNENKSFIRLKNLEFGYKIPSSAISKIGVKSLRLYLNGFNLFTWDKMNQKDWDPELQSTSSYPVYKVLNAGINVNF